ncbi:MAG: rhodanese-like domain-containing protein [Mucilaginibacter sp.]
MEQIDAASLLARLQQGENLNLLDVREEIEYHTYNIGGKNLPLSNIHQNITGLNYNKTDEIIVICKVGLRSETAQTMLIQHGYQNVKNLTGGLIALQKIQ